MFICRSTYKFFLDTAIDFLNQKLKTYKTDLSKEDFYYEIIEK